jgi:Dyp-type peroxidase family
MSAASAPTLDFHDIQGVVLNGYGHLNYSRFVLLKITDAQSARRWLTHIANEISSAKRRRGEDELPGAQNNIAFTRSGLEKLGLPSDTVAAFPREFQMGMAAPERSRRLGDLGVGAPKSWEFGGPKTPEIDVLVMLYARDEAILDHSAANTLGASLAANGVEEIFRQNSIRHGANEPFGFRDGISQPAIEGGAQRVLPGQSVIKAGEFLLGHVDEYGDLVPVPAVSRELDPDRVLLPDPAQATRASFGHNGSFLVFRKLAQDVKGFQGFVERATRNADGSKNPDRAKLLSAKMIGRWPSGAPLTLAPEKDNQELGANKYRNNDFGFATTDRDGFACPVGSHIRRANPRDALAFPPDPKLSLNIANRHRIIRRGRPYREALAASGNEVEQGLLFLAINASLVRQFEFIQQSWLNNPKFNGLYDERDPLSSAIAGGSDAMMTIQAKPVRERLHGLPRFVTVRGGAYFFLPSIRALKFLAQIRS